MTATLEQTATTLVGQALPIIETDLWPSRSESFTKVAGAFAKAQGAIEHAAKDSENSHFKNMYADLASVIDAFRPSFTDNGLSILQPVVPGRPGTITIQTIILHDSGEWIADRGLAMPAGNKAQEHGSALTYARRYALASLVGIAQDDDDAASTAKPAAKAKAAPKAKTERVNLATPEQRDELKARIDLLPEELSKQIGENLRKTGVVWSRLTAPELTVATGWVEECEALAEAAQEGPEEA